MRPGDTQAGLDPLAESAEAPATHELQDEPAAAGDEPAATRSLADDLEALVEDARTYFDAELSYQKSRAGFVADRIKKTIAFGAVAAFLAVLALIGLTVGLIIALTPLITAWGATAVVVLGILFVAYMLVRKASQAWNSMMTEIKSDEEPGDHG